MTRIRSIAVTLMALVAVATLAPSAWAAYYMDATNRGWYDSIGAQSTDNYCVGQGCGSLDERVYTVFDLSGLSPSTNRITAAAVLFANPNGGGGVPRALELHSVTTPIDKLVKPHSPSAKSVDIFEDLGTGMVYGSDAPATVNDSPVRVVLNAEALLVLGKAMGNGKVAMGGRLVNATDLDLLFASTQGGPASSIQLQYQTGPKTSITLKGQNTVPQGQTAKFSGKVSSASASCSAGLEVQITAGSRHFTEITGADGSYSFKTKVTKTTKLRAFYPGTLDFTPPAPCAGSDVRKTVRAT
jgi:hypothetical protein